MIKSTVNHPELHQAPHLVKQPLLQTYAAGVDTGRVSMLYRVTQTHLVLYSLITASLASLARHLGTPGLAGVTASTHLRRRPSAAHRICQTSIVPRYAVSSNSTEKSLCSAQLTRFGQPVDRSRSLTTPGTMASDEPFILTLWQDFSHWSSQHLGVS